MIKVEYPDRWRKMEGKDWDLLEWKMLWYEYDQNAPRIQLEGQGEV